MAGCPSDAASGDTSDSDTDMDSVADTLTVGGGETRPGTSGSPSTDSGHTSSGTSNTSDAEVTSSQSSSSDSTDSTDSTGSADSTDSSAESSGGEISDGVGWAFVAGDGVQTTIGGQGGTQVTASTLEELRQHASASDPRVITVQGTIQGVVEVSSNKTLRGGAGGRIEGGLIIEGPDDGFVSNVIVQDLTIVGTECPGDGCSGRDAISVYRAHHVWIDHCDIGDGDDGNLDITVESDYVTVSWCRFFYTTDEGEHRFSNLIGASDSAVDDADDLRVTLHHNWWTQNVHERMPRVRFGPVHVFNNYFSPADDLYCIRPGVEADLRVENNYFDGASRPFDTPDDTAVIAASGNEFADSPSSEPNVGDAFVPPYEYELDAAGDVPDLVMAGVGPR